MGLDPNDLLQHRAFVRALARRLVFDEDRAEDLVQETWLAALRSPPRDHAGLKAWLAVVVRNFARRATRSMLRRRDRERAAARPEAVGSAEEGVARVHWHRTVVDEVLALEEPYRSTVIQRFFDDLSPKEIAVREGVPASTVRVRLHRALDMLRGRLDRAAGGSRRAWAVALLPLALPKHAGAGAVAAGGVLMTKKAGVLLALLAASLIGTGLVVTRVSGHGGVSSARAAPRDTAPWSAAAVAGDGRAGDRQADDEPTGARAVAVGPEEEGTAKDTEEVVRAYNGQPRLEGRVVGLDGRGIAGVRVVASEGGQRNREEVSTDADGRFVFRLRGSWDLALASYAKVRATSDDIPQIEDAGAGAEIRFEGISGHVVGADGEPVAHGVVLARRPDSDEVVFNAPVDSAGAFAFPRPKGGPFKLTYKTSLVGSEYEAVEGGMDVEEWRTDVVLRLAAGATIEGSVVDPSGVPAADVWIRATVGSVLTGASTDKDGRFTVGGLVPGRDYRLTVWSKGFVPETRGVVAGERSVRFVLDPGLTASARIMFADGKPVVNRPLIIRTEAGLALPQYPVTDGQGRFELCGLPDEQIAVEFMDGKKWRCGSLRAGARDVVLTAADS